MKPADAIRVLRKAVAYQPNLKLDDLSAEAWAEVLSDVPEPDDALDAVAKLGREPRPEGMPWLFSASEVRQAALKMARDRLASRTHLLPYPPRELANDPVAEARWLRERDRAAMARDWGAPPALDAPERDVGGLIRGIGLGPDDEGRQS